MKLVWIAQDLHRGGGQRVICELSRKLAERGHDVEIIYPRGRGGFDIPAGVKMRPCGIEIASTMASLLVNVPALIAAVPLCDWVLCSMPVSTFAGFIAGRLRGAHTLSYVMNDERALFDDKASIHSDLILGLYHRFTDFVHNLPVTIAVNCRWTAAHLHRKQESDYPTIPHGVDHDVFKPEGPALPREATHSIVTVGRKHRWKGLHDLIAALNKVHTEYGIKKDFHLRIITQDDLDLRLAQFPHTVVKPTGDEEIAAAYRSADFLVHPSWFEGLSLPPLEAMACGIPAVLTDRGGILEYARDGENCLLVPPRDPDKMAAAIVTLMKDHDLRMKLAQKAVSTAAQYTWERASDALETILHSH